MLGNKVLDGTCAGSDRVRNQTNRLCFGLGDSQSSTGVPFGRQQCRLLLAFGGNDLCSLLTLCRKDGGFLLAGGRRHRRSTSALGSHLLLHREANLGRRVDVLQLHA